MRLEILQEKEKAEEALNELKRQYDTEVGDLQVTIKKLKKVSELKSGKFFKCFKRF